MKKEDMLSFHKFKNFKLKNLESSKKQKEEIFNLKSRINSKPSHKKS